jgi:nicotinamidase-related amidase
MSLLDDLALSRDRAGLLLVDFQERLARAVPPDVLGRVAGNAQVLLTAARRLGLPILATEQYPRGLGHTVPDLRPLLEGVEVVEKVEFSCCRAPAFADALERVRPRDSVVMAGMETHVCVYQTALDLMARGFKVHVPGDAVASRHKENWETGLRLIERAGASVTSTETVLFQLLGRADTEEFRALSRLIRERAV